MSSSLDAVEVYCDASVSPAKMDQVDSSSIGEEFIGRIVILAPQRDFGFIAMVPTEEATVNGNPASTQLEILAVKKAKEVCDVKGFGKYIILTDNQSAFTKAKVENVRWLEQGKIHYASLFMERIMKRASYLRRSDRKTIKRPPPNRRQQEILTMFNAPGKEFKLSESMIWRKIEMELEAKGSG